MEFQPSGWHLNLVPEIWIIIESNKSNFYRAYQKVDEVSKTMQSIMGVNNRCYWYFLTSNRWLTVHLDFLTSFIVFLVSIQFILQKETTAASEGETLARCLIK